ncbi:hypothetical protein [Streptomyces physcomitrii]|uniref:Integral membrane protein n=1 Tax=Streptomyces physcomitrii TaxID=2724184 RepID=A0ABX1H7K7_9ACTN|nr:hypothetical protein [Streptomyces physcomitrii]NKI43229.1 hypothetical protein [Streptomyces physcomitrii]
MGIESDQLVFDYLSRVGDLAQQRQLPSGARMRLVSELRNEIEQRRARTSDETPASVRRLLDRLGSPEERVTAAGGGAPAAGAAPPSPAAVPSQREDERPPAPARRGLLGKRSRPARPEAPGDRKAPEQEAEQPRLLPKSLRRRAPRPRTEETPPPAEVPSPPHLASAVELGDQRAGGDWWSDRTPFGPGESVPGFVGGIEIPEILRPPPQKADLSKPLPAGKPGESGKAAEAEDAGEEAAEEAVVRGRLRLLAGGWSNPLLLLAALSLLAGAVLGNLVVLAVGWLIAYLSRRLTSAESKTAVLVLPGLSLLGGAVWLWGRSRGRWGEAIADGRMSEAIADTWPWVLRAAALASAAYVVWRSQRRR